MAEPPRRVVVAAPNWLGDAVMGLPALRAVRAHAPAAHLAVAARPSVAALYAMVPEVDAVIPLSPPAPLWRMARLAAGRRPPGGRALRPGGAAAQLVPVGVDCGQGRHPRTLGLRGGRARPRS